MIRFIHRMLFVVVFTVVITNLVKAQAVPDGTVKSLLMANRSQLGITEEDIMHSNAFSAHYDRATGVKYVYLQQFYKDIVVFNSIKTIVFKNDELAYTSGKFIQGLGVIAPSEVPQITGADAIKKAAQVLNLSAASGITEVENNFSSTKTIIYSPSGIAKDNIEAKLVWVSENDGMSVQLAWKLNIDVINSNDYWQVAIDASKGELVSKYNLNISCNFGTAEHHEKVKNNSFKSETTLNKIANATTKLPPNNITSVTYNVIPYPFESRNFSRFSLQTDPWTLFGTNNDATTYGWHYDGTTNWTITKGNNVSAYDDSLHQNSPGRYDTSSTGIPTLSFLDNYDTTNVPTTPTNRHAATANLFYWNNLMHDMSYQYGFTEAAGNFQTDNMGRGGKGNDAVLAEAQDGSSTNNANFNPLQDGQNGRMQMFLWTTTTPGRDGDLDNLVIAHEYTHGISNRLTGGVIGRATCLQNAEQGGEGWSDYVGLMMTTDWSTAKLSDSTKKRTIGTYVNGQIITGKGIRTYPYCTPINVNKHTYKDVANTTYNGEVHYIGEVWCSALWDLTWYLIKDIGFISPNFLDSSGQGGNIVAMKLMMMGLKLQPCSPGYLDARDAILAADSILYNNAHKCTIWKAFAHRGMGWSAVQGSANSTTDQVAAFDMPPSMTFEKSIVPSLVEEGNQVTVNFKTTCGCIVPQNNYKIVDSIPSGFTYVSSTNGTVNGNTVNFGPISFTSPLQSQTFSLTLQANTGVGCLADSVVNDNRDNNLNGGFTPSTKSNKSVWASSNAYSYSPTNSWHGQSDSMTNNFWLTSGAFTPQSFSIFSFWHTYLFEKYYDGGVVEYSTDNGTTWNDASSYFLENPYNTSMESSSNLSGRMAYSGGIFGTFKQSILDLSSFNGQSIKIRFRISTSLGVSVPKPGKPSLGTYPGWYIDDISVTNGCGGLNKAVLFNAINKKVDSLYTPLFITASTLPVKLVSFGATQLNKEVLLKWSTAQEINTDKFIVERSLNGVEWKTLGVQNALNSIGSHDYSLNDYLPVIGSNFYRLKMVDKDGKFSYSTIAKVVFDGKENVLVVSPNPAGNYLNIYLSNTITKGQILLLDAQGRTVLQNNFYNLINGSIKLNTEKLTNGVYMLQLIPSNGVLSTQRLIIAK